MNKEQQSLLELLVKVRDFLDENEIRFYLFGGSCLGAIRHRGFIPWDNDIDIIIDRKNYSKLINTINKNPWDDIEFVCFENNEDYFRPFGQFSSKRDTYFLKSRVFNKGLCMGTIIDVFVMDFVPENRLENYKRALLMYEEVLAIYRVCRNEIKDYQDEYFRLVDKEKHVGRKTVVQELRNELEQYSPDDSDYLVTRFWVNKFRCFRKDWFGEPEYVQFEGEKMPVPSNAVACLRFQYGYDWYMLPDEDNRKAKSFYINHNISSNNFVNDINNFINNDIIQQLLENRKHFQVSRLQSQLNIQRINNQLKCYRLVMELEAEGILYSQKGMNILFDNIKCFEIAGNGSDYFEQGFINRWIREYIYNGRYYQARKVQKVFGNSDSAELLMRIERLAMAHQDKDVDRMATCLSEFSEDEKKKIPDCIRARVVLCLSGAVNCWDINEIRKDCENYLDKYPDNYEIIKTYGDVLLAFGDELKAKEIYELVLKHSKNGMDLLEIRDRNVRS